MYNYYTSKTVIERKVKMKRKIISILMLVSLLAVTLSIFQAVSATGEQGEYLQGSTELLNSYLDKAYALKEEIINSKTEVEWTGTAYYVSNKGNDNSDGKTPATAWATVGRVAKAELKSGDAVLFERGGKFRYTETLQTVAGVTYSAYGTGAKPELIGSLNASGKGAWSKTEFENIYVYKDKIDPTTGDVGVIVFDRGAAWGIKMQSEVYNGTISNGLEKFASGGYKITSPDAMKNDLEFWHDPNSGNLYLYSRDKNPGERFASIELADKGSGISGVAHGVTIDNLAFFGFGSHAIGYGGIGDNAPRGLTVQNCTFSFIGGSRQDTSSPEITGRFGNAVEVYGGAHGYIIRNCYADNVYDCCWTVQYQSDSEGVDVWFEDIEFYNNVACYSNTGLEVWLYNRPEYGNDTATYGMRNLNLHDNYTFFNGFGWSEQRPNKDGNIFYGDPSYTTTVYENCSVHDNVGMFASKWINYLRYPGTNHYNFNHNIYFQKPNLSIGGVPQNPETGEGNIYAVKYQKEDVEKLLSTGFEPGSKFYALDYDIPRYTPDEISFDDVADNHWARGNIKTAVLRNYFNGTSSTTFSPDSSMTRAMLAVVLSRITGESKTVVELPYTDLAENAWYLNGISYVFEKGAIDKNEKTFRPDAAVTREEIADMLYKLTLSEYKTKSYEDAALEFKDAASVSDKYKAGVAFAVANGIISGYTDGTVMPQKTATRAEVATMLTRFADYYVGLNPDFSTLSSSTDNLIKNASDIISSSIGTADKLKVTVGGSEVLRLKPPSIMHSGAPTLVLMEKFMKFDLIEYPYMKIRLKNTSEAASYKITVEKGGMIGSASFENVSGAWSNTIVSLNEVLPFNNDIDYTADDARITISPWGAQQFLPTYNVDYCDIEYIGFFPTLEAANAYTGDFEKVSTNVSFIANGKAVEIVNVAIGSPLEYTKIIPVLPAYEFKGWDIKEGTPVTDNMVVTAVFEKIAGAPAALFTTVNATANAAGGLVVSEKTEDGITFYRFSADGKAKLSSDSTRANVFPDSANYDVQTSKIMKIAYRTNIESSSAIDFNLSMSKTQRLWGPIIQYTKKGEWVEAALDLSTANWIGGESVESGYTNTQYFETYITGDVYRLLFKPYWGNGLTITNDDYFDLAAIAFFDTIEEAKAYSLLK